VAEPWPLGTYLRRLAWARLAAVALVLATGAALRYWGAAHFDFARFALSLAVAVSSRQPCSSPRGAGSTFGERPGSTWRSMSA
jgi:hypothetical protein